MTKRDRNLNCTFDAKKDCSNMHDPEELSNAERLDEKIRFSVQRTIGHRPFAASDHVVG